MLLHGSPGGTLGYLAGVNKAGGVVLAVLVRAMQVWGSGESHHLTGCEEQGISDNHF